MAAVNYSKTLGKLAKPSYRSCAVLMHVSEYLHVATEDGKTWADSEQREEGLWAQVALGKLGYL